LSDPWDEDEVAQAATQEGLATLSLMVREDGLLVDTLDMPRTISLEVATGQLPAAKAFQRKLAQFIGECEAAVIRHMQEEGAREIPGFVLEQPTAYIVGNAQAFDADLIKLATTGKLSQEDYEKAVTHHPVPTVPPPPTFDNRTLNSLATKRGAAVAEVIHKHRTEMPGAAKLKVKG
jgi:hypothetical protein